MTDTRPIDSIGSGTRAITVVGDMSGDGIRHIGTDRRLVHGSDTRPVEGASVYVPKNCTKKNKEGARCKAAPVKRSKPAMCVGHLRKYERSSSN